MSITYNSTTKTITVSGETNCNFEALYQASVAGGWNVIEKPYENVYYLNAMLSLATNTTFVDTNKTILINGYLINQTNTNIILVNSGCTLTLGNLADSTYKVGNQGCDLKFIHIQGQVGRPLIYNNGTINLYGCKISADSTQLVYFWSAGTWKIYSCLLQAIQFESVNNVNNDVANTIFINVYTYSTTLQLSNVRWLLGVPNYGHSNLTLTDCYVINPNPLKIFRSGDTSKLKLINTPSTNYSYTLGGANVNNSGTIEIYYTISPSVITIDKQPIQGANIKLFDKNNTLVLDTTTDVNGTISSDIIQKLYKFMPDNTLVITDYNPFTLVVSKDGYETYTSTFDLTEKYRSIITLTPPEYIYLDKISMVENLNPKINDELLSCNIQQDIISATIKSEN